MEEDREFEVFRQTLLQTLCDGTGIPVSFIDIDKSDEKFQKALHDQIEKHPFDEFMKIF